jgi:hypothetical protein
MMADGNLTAEQCLDLAETRLRKLEAAIEAQHGGVIDIGLHLQIVTVWRELGTARLEVERYKEWLEQ